MTGAQFDLQQLDQIDQLGSGPDGAYTLTVSQRPRGLVSQIVTVIVRPGEFFHSLTLHWASRQWVLIGALVLILVGLSAVKYQTASQASTGGGDAALGGDLSGASIDPFGGGGGGASIDGGFDTGIPSGGVPTAGGASAEPSATDRWTSALIAGSNVLLAWFILAVLLGLVPLMNGRAPRFGNTLQVAVWASVPLGLMAALQMVYFLLGGTAGGAGLSGLLTEWSRYDTLSEPVQKVAMSAAGRLTLFAVWALVLAYIGGRRALRGRWWVVLPVVLAWAAIIVVLPVLFGTVDLPQSDEVAQGDGMEMLDPSMMDGGLMGEGDSMGEGDFMGEPGMDGMPLEGMDGVPLDGTAEAAPGGESVPFATGEAPEDEAIVPEPDVNSDSAPRDAAGEQPSMSVEQAPDAQSAPIIKKP